MVSVILSVSNAGVLAKQGHSSKVDEVEDEHTGVREWIAPRIGRSCVFEFDETTMSAWLSSIACRRRQHRGQ